MPCIYGFFLTFFREKAMKQAHRFFNLLLPFNVYEELKRLSVETDKSIAEIVRQAVNLFLDKIKTSEGIQND